DLYCNGYDDYGTIQTIFSGLQRGQSVHFGEGNFELKDGLIIQSKTNFRLSGLGRLYLSGATASNPYLNTYDVLPIVDCSFFTIDGLETDGNRHCDITWGTDNTDYAPDTQYLTSNASSGQADVTVQDGTKFVVGERITVYGGLTVNGGAERDYKDNGSGHGLAITNIAGNILTLESNLSNTYTATGAAGGGYVTTYQTGYNNSIGGYTLGDEDQQNGIHLIGCHDFLVYDCYSHDVWESPIKCGVGFADISEILSSRCYDGFIVNNECIRGYDQGVSIWNSDNIFPINNKIEEGGWGGVVLTGSDKCIAIGNISKRNFYRVPGDNNSGHGIAIEGGANNLIYANVATENHCNGILLANSPMEFGVSGTTLSASASWGTTTLSMTSITGFAVGATYCILDGEKSESFTVESITDSNVTTTEKIKFFHPSGTSVGKRLSESNIIAYNETSENDEGHGVYISRSIRNHIEHNDILRNYKKGCLVEIVDSLPSQGNYIEYNTFDGNGYVDGGQSILVDTVDHTYVNHNDVWHTFNEKSIHLKGSRHSQCNANDVHDGTNEGIYFEDGGGITCSDDSCCDNNVSQCDSSGIRIVKGSGFDISRNKCRANTGNGGICCDGVSYSNINDNDCVSNQTNGILMQDDGGNGCTNNAIKNNLVRDDGTGTKGSDRSSITQTNSIVLTGNEANNSVTGNIVDAAISKVSTTTVVKDNIGYLAQGEIRTASGSLSAGNANAISAYWHNPESQDIYITKIEVSVTTAGGTAGSHLDVGISDDSIGTNLGTEFFNDLDLNTTQVNDSWTAVDGGQQTKWVLCQDSASATDGYVVFKITDANAANLVGSYYIEYVGV
ncbi:MAG: right-handed parallel beta-helix repeat-containing protein, partial [Nitrospira sp.]|nr:right-handed parallel beta-helix repeat-containing protein [Nitrospira sp.]